MLPRKPDGNTNGTARSLKRLPSTNSPSSSGAKANAATTSNVSRLYNRTANDRNNPSDPLSKTPKRVTSTGASTSKCMPSAPPND